MTTETPIEQVPTIHCCECGDPETEQRAPYRRTYSRGRTAWVCSWCDRQAALDAEGDRDE